MTGTNKMRDAFEAGWGYTNEEQECYFIPELNMYGSAKVNQAAERKSTAWAYFQKGWQASRQAVVVELKEPAPLSMSCNAMFGYQQARKDDIQSIEAHGLRVGVRT